MSHADARCGWPARLPAPAGGNLQQVQPQVDSWITCDKRSTMFLVTSESTKSPAMLVCTQMPLSLRQMRVLHSHACVCR